jgi:hypothetical protein
MEPACLKVTVCPSDQAGNTDGWTSFIDDVESVNEGAKFTVRPAGHFSYVMLIVVAWISLTPGIANYCFIIARSYTGLHWLVPMCTAIGRLLMGACMHRHTAGAPA